MKFKFLAIAKQKEPLVFLGKTDATRFPTYILFSSKFDSLKLKAFVFTFHIFFWKGALRSFIQLVNEDDFEESKADASHSNYSNIPSPFLNPILYRVFLHPILHG